MKGRLRYSLGDDGIWGTERDGMFCHPYRPIAGSVCGFSYGLHDCGFLDRSDWLIEGERYRTTLGKIVFRREMHEIA